MAVDNALLNRLQMGEVSAFEEIYWKFHGQLFKNILKIVKDTSAAEDILQEVFIALWQNKELMDPGKAISNWLFVVSHNKSISHLRETAKLPLAEIEGVELTAAEHPAKDNFTEKQWELLMKGMNELSPQKQKVF